MKTRKFCPVGNILPGVNLVIMDKDQKVQPVGASGEVIITYLIMAALYVPIRTPLVSSINSTNILYFVL